MKRRIFKNIAKGCGLFLHSPVAFLEIFLIGLLLYVDVEAGYEEVAEDLVAFLTISTSEIGPMLRTCILISTTNGGPEIQVP